MKQIREGFFIHFSPEEWKIIQEFLGEDYSHDGNGIKELLLDLCDNSEEEENPISKMKEWIEKNPEKTGLIKKFLMEKVKKFI